MNDTKISKILNKLLSEHQITVSELARQVGLHQPTIQRIAAGVCEHPYVSSLEPIAKYFSISVDQLKGLEPIPRFDNIFKLPLISWDEAVRWNKRCVTKSQEYVLADLRVSEYAYALKVIDGAMEPVFFQGTTLILDPAVPEKDKSYVIALIKNANVPIFRQIIMNGQDKFLKPLSPDTNIYKMTRLKDADKILATVVQAKWNYVS